MDYAVMNIETTPKYCHVIEKLLTEKLHDYFVKILDDQVQQVGDTDAKSWSVPRQGYSYSDRFSYNNKSRGTNISTSGRELGDIIAEDSNKTCDDEDFDSKKNRLNARLPVPGAPQIATREMSARTKRAQKLHQAHMKSSGFGQFSSGSVSYTRRVDDDSNVKWQKKDDLT